MVALVLNLPHLLKSQIVKPLNTPINDPAAKDCHPSLSADGQVMLFLSDRFRRGQLQMYESVQIAENRWSPPKPVLPTFFQKAFVSGAFLSFDASTIYFHGNYEFKNIGQEDIYFSQRKGDGWGEPENLGEPINSPGYEGSPSLSADGHKLFFLRMKNNGSCPMIMMALKGRNGKWLPPVELPPVINKSCEQTPRILPDGKTLLFASDRSGGKGGYDLYLSHWQPGGSWSEPENLAYLNTEQDDFAATFSLKDQVILYESNQDIMQASLPPGQDMMQQSFSIVKGTTKDAVSFKPNASRIIIRDLSASQKPQQISSDLINGSFQAVLPNGANYSLEVFSENFIVEKREINLATATSHQILEMDVKQLPEMIELHYQFTDSLRLSKIQPELTIYSAKDKMEVPLTYDARQNIYKARVKLHHNYYVEANLEGYSTFHDQLYLEKVKSYKPLLIGKAMRRQFYLFTFKAVDSRSAKSLQETEFTITDLDNRTRMFPFFDPTKGQYMVELREKGSYKIEMAAKGYKSIAKEIESFQLIRIEALNMEIKMESNF